MENEHPTLSGHLYRTFCCTGCGHQIKAPVYCGNRFCPVCSIQRRRRTRAKLVAIVNCLNPAPGSGFKLLTLTIPNQVDIACASQLIVKSFRKLRQRAFWKNKCTGGCFVLEVTGAPNRWHVHLHAILESRYIKHTLLSKQWASVSPGKIVYISAIPVGAIVAYVTKYISKASVPEAFIIQASDGLRGTRLFQPFGSWHSISLKIPKIRYHCPECGYDSWFLIDESNIRRTLKQFHEDFNISWCARSPPAASD